MYYVTTQGRDKLTLFLVDRSKTKNQWWTTELWLAMAFRKESSADYSANRLRYKNPEVVDSETAKMMELENNYINRENGTHPFSGEAFGDC